MEIKRDENVLQTLLKRSVEKSKEFRILEFEDSAEIAVKILDDFMSFYDEKAESFPLSITATGSDKRFGTITDIMALSTFLELQSLKAEIEGTTAEIFYKLVSKVFASVYSSEKPIFDASPYLAPGELTDYVETAAKIIPTMVDLRDFLIECRFDSPDYVLPYPVVYPEALLVKVERERSMAYSKGSTDSELLLRCTERLIADTAKMLNDSAIHYHSNDGSKLRYLIDGKPVVRKGISDSEIAYRGWAFKTPLDGHDNEYDTSLFYTYLATNAFISIYNSMEAYYDAMDQNVDPYENINPDFLSRDDKRRHNKFKEDKEFYGKYEKILSRFRNITASAGRYIDHMLRSKGVNIAYNYVDKDLNAVDQAEILKTKNNHVMNSLFTYAILINAGVDDDYYSAGKSNMYQTIQFALNNIKKIYLEVCDQEREDFIDSYTMGEDRCPSDERKIMQEWRKTALPSPYDLVPLYCNTYNLISDYIIKYPQKEMTDNLIWVMESKQEGKWYWTKNGFNLNNNLYYILSLDYFYIYYNYYETVILKPYQERSAEEAYKKRIAEMQTENSKQMTELKTKSQEELDKQKEQYEKQLLDVRKQKSSLDVQVESFIKEVLEEEWGRLFNIELNRFIDHALQCCVEYASSNESEIDDVEKRLKGDESFAAAMVLASLEKSATVARDNHLEDKCIEVRMKELKNAIIREFLDTRK